MTGRITDKGRAVARLIILGEYKLLPNRDAFFEFPDSYFDGGDAKGLGRLWCRWLAFRVWLQRLTHGREYHHPARH